MALSVKTKEADRLARELSRLTGETMTEAITRSLAERLERVRRAREAGQNLPERVSKLADRISEHYDTRPVTKQEWDDASGESE